MSSERIRKLKQPVTKYGYIESPKDLFAYLKAGCEIKQIGRDRTTLEGRYPEYWLIAPGLIWKLDCMKLMLRLLSF